MDKMIGKNKNVLFGVACFFAGLVCGFLLSPAKGGIHTTIGSYNGASMKGSDKTENGK